MELLQLEYFKKVAKLEHMTKAANQLHISQSSLSRTITRLENDLGVKLFDREGRDIKLNSYGILFLKRVENIFLELENGREELNEKQGIENKTIRVGATITRLLPNLFKAFLEIYPDTKFQLFQLSSSDLESHLEKGLIDFAITTPPLDKKGLKSVIIKEEKIFLAISPSHHLSNIKKIKIQHLESENFIALTDDYNFQNSLKKLCEEVGFSPKIMFESNDIEVISKLVIDNFGIAFMPAYWWDENRILNPKKIELSEDFSKRLISLSWNEHKNLTNLLTQFKDFTLTYFSYPKRN
ncbi:MAG: LysR family transcriptional regulator [Sarcina sp.]